MSEIKTKYMAFGKIKDVKLKLNGKLLEHVQSYKRLGNIISSIKQWRGIYLERIIHIYVKNQENLPLRSWTKQKNLHIPPQCISHMYQSIIQPILLYGSDIWGMNTAAHRFVR